MNVRCSLQIGKSSQRMKRFIQQRLDTTLKTFRSRIDSIHVRLSDENGPRGGVAHRCGIDLMLIPSGSLHVTGQGDDGYLATRNALQRLKRVLARRIDQKCRGRAIRHLRGSRPRAELPATDDM